MNSLDRAVELVLQWTAERQKDRSEVAGFLEELIGDCRAALAIWQEYVAAPGAPGDKFSLVSWVGPDRAKRLHEINLRAKERLEHACRLAGPRAGRFATLDEDIVEMAYRHLQPEETGPQAAQKAIEGLNARIDTVRRAVERIRAAPPAQKAAGREKPTAKGKAAKRSSAPRGAKKRTPTKKPAPKKK